MSEASSAPVEGTVVSAATGESGEDLKPANPGAGDSASKVTAELAAKKPRKKKKKKKKVVDPFKDFHDFKQPVNKLPHHRVLAVNRGERSGKLKVKIESDEAKMLARAQEVLVSEEHPFKDFLRKCVEDSLNRLTLPSLEREVRRELTEQAEKHAVEVFSSNLKHLLLQPPTHGKTILAIDPGFKRGCSVAVLTPAGGYVESAHIFVVGNKSRKDESIAKLADLVRRNSVDLIAIGNGTACRETEQLVSDLIGEHFADCDLRYVMVNEAGASVYSTSEIGREEFPDVTPNVRSAISIGRRLIDPISELVKIAPANIGVGMYQHDVKAKHLSESLDQVVQFCVNRVGVNVNTASPSLLRFVSGLNQLTARRIYEYRQGNGPFPSREKLKDVTGFGQTTFTQAAGFLRINDGVQPLDSTSIHPESYEIAEKIIKQVDADTATLFPRLQESPKRAVRPKSTTASLDSKPAGEVEAETAIGEVSNGTLPDPVSGEATAAEPSVQDTTPAAAPESAPAAAVEDTTSETVSDTTSEAVSDTTPESTEDTASETTQDKPELSEPVGEAVSEVSSESDGGKQDPAAVEPVDANAAAPVQIDPAVAAAEEKAAEAKKARQEVINRIKAVDAQALANEFSVGNFLIKDIVNNLIRPRRDPRDGVSRPIFRKGIIKVDDLKPGVMLDGQVVNVVDFGVFVDIGLGESCLVHVSQLSNRYISDPHQLFAVGEVIKVWVNEIDTSRRRVKLTAINPKAETKPRERRRRSKPVRRESGPAQKQERRKGTKRDRPRERTQTTRARRTPKPVKPITKGMLEGKEPMRSFSDLLQFVEKKPDDTDGDKK